MVLARQAKCACMTAERQKQTSKNGKISPSGDKTPPNHAKIDAKPGKPPFPDVSTFGYDLCELLNPILRINNVLSLTLRIDRK